MADHSGCACAEAFLQGAAPVRIGNFSYAEQSIFHDVAPVFEQGNEAVARYAPQDGTGSGWRDDAVVHHKKQVHGAHFLHVFFLHGIHPHHLVVTGFFGAFGRQQRGTVIAGAFGLSYPTPGGTGKHFLHPEANRFGVIRANRAGKNDKTVCFGHLYAEKFVRSKHEWPNVQRVAFCIRHPVFVQFNQHFDGRQEKRLGHLWHAHALSRNIQAAGVHLGAKQKGLTSDFGGLHALENALSVMKRQVCGRYFHIRKWNYAQIRPFLPIKISHKHVIRYNLPKRNVRKINISDARSGRRIYIDGILVYHTRFYLTVIRCFVSVNTKLRNFALTLKYCSIQTPFFFVKKN